tara:strand:+ start:3813 stop:4259 length:447 start_codon:yes stop_codon:yes gene_type:complete
MKLIKATQEMAIDIGLGMREEDELEVRLSHDLDPVTAMLESFINSDICRAIEGDDGTPVGMTGVTKQAIWMLGTDGLTSSKNHKKTLCVDGKKWIDYCLKEVGKPIGNWVYAENKKSIKWLKYLGFTVNDPRPYGHNRALFCQFWRFN